VNVYSFLHVAACVLDFYPFIQIQNVLFRREMVKRGGSHLGLMSHLGLTGLEESFINYES
jgi:hypothetical protein